MADEFKGKVLVLGGRGMLGRRVAKAARAAGYAVWAPDHIADIADRGVMRTLESSISPHIVVNCAGQIPARMGLRTNADMVRTNALGPWVVVDSFSRSRVIHVSTDCVFSGRRAGAYTHDDKPDADDLYGRSKALGEAHGAVVVRTSFIGLEHGLARWFLDQPSGAVVEGWSGAWWNGATTIAVAEALVQNFFDREPGIWHLGSSPLTKYELLRIMAGMWRPDIQVRCVNEPRINRILKPDVYMERRLDLLNPALVARAS